MALDVQIKRIYDRPVGGDGYRVLVDHVGLRGVSRERAKLDRCACELAPSDELRNWCDHVPERSDESCAGDRAELADQGSELRARASNGRLTIVCAARDREHINAVVLAKVLRDG
jgi:uncharacterized protein YeaO (DUF488 family)